MFAWVYWVWLVSGFFQLLLFESFLNNTRKEQQSCSRGWEEEGRESSTLQKRRQVYTRRQQGGLETKLPPLHPPRAAHPLPHHRARSTMKQYRGGQRASLLPSSPGMVPQRRAGGDTNPDARALEIHFLPHPTEGRFRAAAAGIALSRAQQPVAVVTGVRKAGGQWGGPGGKRGTWGSL